MLKNHFPRASVILGLLLVPFRVVGVSQDAAVQSAAIEILQKKCETCHGSSQISGLDLRKRESVLKGGGRGPAIVPGKAGESLLYRAAAHEGDLKMPPGSLAPLPADELATLQKWKRDFPSDVVRAFETPAEKRSAKEVELATPLLKAYGEIKVEEHFTGSERALHSQLKQRLVNAVLDVPQECTGPVSVKGRLAAGDLSLPAMIPLVGTHYRRSSTEPLKTAQERQFSKTGLPQYAEQERDWKATIRVYKSSKEPAEVFFIFQVRDAGSQPIRAEFKLRTEALDGKR